MRKKIMKSFFVAASVITMISGCSGKSDTKGNAPPSNENTTAAQKEQTSGDVAVPNDKPVTIKYLQWQQEFQTGAISLADAYMAEHPNVTIEVVTDASGYFENLKTSLVAGDVPEIFVTEGYNNMKAYSEYITDLSDQPWVDSIVDTALPCITLDGSVMGMPITMAGEGLIYNKAMFEEHGWKIPKTLTELTNLCEKIRAADIMPFTNQFSDDWLIGQFVSAGGYAYIPNVDQFTMDMFAGTEKLANNEQMKKSLEIFDILLKYGQEAPMGYGWNEACTAFALGESAMMFEGDWVWDTVYPINPQIDCGMFALPATDNPDDTKMIVDANALWHVGKGSDEPEAAIEYLKWIATSDVAKEIMLKELKVVPVFEGWEYAADNLLAKSTIEYMELGETYPWSWPTWPDGYRPAAGKIYQEYIGGSLTKDGVLMALDDTWRKLVAGTK